MTLFSRTFSPAAHSNLINMAERCLSEMQPTEFGFEGVLGSALFACAMQRLNPRFDGQHWVGRAIEWLNDHGADPGMYGLAGLATTMALYAPEEEETLALFDRALLDALPRMTTFDWHDGLAGLAPYCALRAKTVGGQALRVEVQAGLLAALQAQAPVPFSISAAHGLTAPLVGLATLSQLGHKEVDAAIRAGLQTLWRYERPGANRFGWIYAAGAADPHPKPQRPGSWCWGDPGVLRGVFLAARACGDDASAERSLALARHDAALCLSVEPPGETNLFSLCCGCTISAHIYRRYFRDSAEPIFLQASDHIFDSCIEQLPKLDRLDFQHGRLGIILALLYAASDESPDWDVVRGVSLCRLG